MDQDGQPSTPREREQARQLRNPVQPSFDPETKITTLASGVRVDEQGRMLCSAHRRDKTLCKGPAMMGTNVCRMHGGSSPQVRNKAKLRLAELVNPAISTLAREMVNTQAKPSDRLSAANSVLDRTGWGRVQRVETADAREMLAQRLMELRENETLAIDNEEDSDGQDS